MTTFSKRHAPVVLRVRQISTNTITLSSLLAPTPQGITIGSASSSVIQCREDPRVSPEHGTLECTQKCGVWVYVDHSINGTVLVNGSGNHIHNTAVVVSHGDKLLLGSLTELEILMGDVTTGETDLNRQVKNNDTELQDSKTTIKDNAVVVPTPPTRQETRRKSMLGRTAQTSLPMQAKPLIPTIVTSGERFYLGDYINSSNNSSQSTTPEYINSPIPGNKWRKKRHSIAVTTHAMPFPPSIGGPVDGTQQSNQLAAHHRMQAFTPAAPLTPPRQDATRPIVNVSPQKLPSKLSGESDQSIKDDAHDRSQSPIHPPPLEYSASPVSTPTFMNRVHVPQQQSQPTNLGALPFPLHQHVEPTSKPRRDDLRIQVSKKMAGFQAVAVDGKRPCQGNMAVTRSDMSTGLQTPSPNARSASQTPTRAVQHQHNNQLDFTPPSSPVAHRDILRQKETLLSILKSKYKEEQLLKQQQEEWMRQNFKLGGRSPPLSPIKSDSEPSNNNDLDSGDETEIEIPPQIPELLRTISGRYHQPSPRLTAAVFASRSRQEALEQSKHQDYDDTIAPKSPHQSSVFSSVESSASTVLACHRRVTRSLSFTSSMANSSGELSDFLGYDEEDMDDITSFTTHALYSTDEFKTTASRDDSLMSLAQFSYPSSTASSHTATTDGYSINELEDDNVLNTSSNSDNNSPSPERDIMRKIMDANLPTRDTFDANSPYKSALRQRQTSPMGSTTMTNTTGKPAFRRGFTVGM